MKSFLKKPWFIENIEKIKTTMKAHVRNSPLQMRLHHYLYLSIEFCIVLLVVTFGFVQSNIAYGQEHGVLLSDSLLASQLNKNKHHRLEKEPCPKGKVFSPIMSRAGKAFTNKYLVLVSHCSNVLTPPSGLIAVANGTQVTLSWFESSPTAKVMHYEVWRSGNNNSTKIGSTTTLSFSDTPPGDPTTFQYRIRAVDQSGHPTEFSNITDVETNSFLLTVSVVGTGSGTVTSDVAGIACPGDCTESYTIGQEVVLTAATNRSDLFVGWSGDGCSGTVTTCTVTMSQARTVTATFDAPVGGTPIQINFQPGGAVVPNGYVKDDGAVYSSARGYGWSTAVPTRERNNAGVEQRLDTLIHFDTGTTAAWNYDLANGDYLVTLASGDPNWSQGPHTVAVEGTTVIDGVSTSANEFITITEQPVTVTDGQLTVQLTRSGTAKTILNYVVITSAGSGPGDAPPSAPGPVSMSGVTASSVTVNWGVASDDVGVAEYEVARCTGAGCTTYSVLATVAHPTVTYTDTTVGASTTYGYQVVAKDTAGQVGPAVVSGDVTTASATSGVTDANWGPRVRRGQ